MIYVSLTRGDNEKICWLFMTSVAASLSPISLSLSLRFFLRRALVPRCYRFRCTRTTSRLPINFSLATHPTKLTVSVPFDRDRGPSLSYNFLLKRNRYQVSSVLSFPRYSRKENLWTEKMFPSTLECDFSRDFSIGNRSESDRSVDRRKRKRRFRSKGEGGRGKTVFTGRHYFPAHV